MPQILASNKKPITPISSKQFSYLGTGFLIILYLFMFSDLPLPLKAITSLLVLFLSLNAFRLEDYLMKYSWKGVKTYTYMVFAESQDDETLNDLRAVYADMGYTVKVDEPQRDPNKTGTVSILDTKTKLFKITVKADTNLIPYEKAKEANKKANELIWNQMKQPIIYKKAY